jgi:carboxymethylenebutenolidase
VSILRAVATAAPAFAGVTLLLAACRRPAPADEHSAHMSAADRAAPTASASGTTGTAGLPPSNGAAAARLASSPRHGEWVKVAWEPGSKDSLMAWVVYPSTGRAKSPVVVVVHEIFGLSTWVRGVADQVAAEGFIAVAPDLLSRVRGGPSTVELPGDQARGLIQGVDPAEKNRGIGAVARWAMSQASAAPRYAVIGYCWGGTTVFQHAIDGGTSGFSGGVAFYGLPYMNGQVPNTDSLRKITKPVMLLSGSKDQRIGAAMPALDSAMTALGKSYVGVNYPGAVHGFLRAQDDPKSPARDEAEEQANLAATKDAWPRTVAFLKRNLGI